MGGQAPLEGAAWKRRPLCQDPTSTVHASRAPPMGKPYPRAERQSGAEGMDDWTSAECQTRHRSPVGLAEPCIHLDRHEGPLSESRLEAGGWLTGSEFGRGEASVNQQTQGA